MENFRIFIQRFFSQTGTFWTNLSVGKKIAFTTVALTMIGLIVSLAFYNKSDPYEYVFEELSPDDTKNITTFLKTNNVDFVSDNRGIKVPSRDVLRLRLKLSEEGLPAHGVVGWEKFDKQEFARTEFEQLIHKQRAIQGELSRTIMMIEGVTKAKVHITMPKKSLFLEEQRQPTAAIYVKTKHGFQLDKKQIKGVVHLVSRSVEGLKPNAITVIDYEGRMLNEPESDDPASKMTKEMLEFKRAIEKKYEENIRGIVGRVVGPDRIEVKVDAMVDFTQEHQTISNVDPDRTAVVSRETQGSSLEGHGLNPTGIPGSKSNVPGEQEELSVASSTTQNKKESEVVNFEVSKTVSQKTLPVGKITRLTTAVLVDGKQPYSLDGSAVKFEARTEEELKQIEDLVRSAVGFTDSRGDVVTVRNMMFQLDPIRIENLKEEQKQSQDYLVSIAIAGATSLALVLFFLFVVRPYLRWLNYDPQKREQQELVEEFKPDLEVGSLQQVLVKEDVPFEKLTPQEQVLFLAKHEPKRTTEAIRLLLNPHQSST